MAGRCAVPGCFDPLYLRGHCCKHYARLRRYGDPIAGGKFLTKRGELLRFYREQVLTFTGDGCLFWPYVRQSDGYGTLTLDGQCRLVHRMACEERHGPAPTDEHEAAHSCGNGHLGCVSPQHVRWATPKQNQADKRIHGTQPLGERCSGAKLTEETVRYLRQLPSNYDRRAVAARLGVHPNTVSQARLHKWSHVA